MSDQVELVGGMRCCSLEYGRLDETKYHFKDCC